MGMRSIVGRFLILAVLLASLGVIAQAAIKISQASGKAVAKASPAAQVASLAASPAQNLPVQAAPVQAPPARAAAALDAPASIAPASLARASAPQPAADAPIRVVYPGPLGDSATPPPRKIADAAPASPLPTATVPQPAPSVPTLLPPTQAVPAAKPPAATVVASVDNPAVPSAEPTASGKGGVDLNSASVDALNRLGGGHIGQSIVQHRPYRSVEDLVKKRVIRRSVYEQIKAQVAAQ